MLYYTKKIFAAFLLNILIMGCLYAQEKYKDSINFHGRIDSIGNKGYYISVGYREHDWFVMAASINKSVEIDSLGRFEFNLPKKSLPYKVDITLRKRLNNPSKPFLTVWDGLYYIEATDDIEINFSFAKDGKNHPSLFFSGRGSDKYTLIEKLNEQFSQYATEGLNSIKIYSGQVKDQAELEIKLGKIASLLRQSIAAKQVLILNSNVSPQMKQILNHEFAQYNSEWVFRAKLCYNVNPDFRKEVVNLYLRHVNEFDEKSDLTSILCPSHLLRLSARDAFEQMIRQSNGKANIVDVYNMAKANYPKSIRERLMSNCFFSPYVQQNFASYSAVTRDSLLQDAYHFIEDTTIKDAIGKLISDLNNAGSGKPVYDAEFIDRHDQPFNIKSLKGKVVMIDLWFNGCLGCAQFHEAFEKEAYQKLKNNKNFVVIGLSIDATKERWVARLKSHLYTDDNYINIWTGPKILNHPFLKYYGVNGAPFVMLIDAEGKIFSKIDPGTSMASLIEKIDKALNK